MPDFASYTLYIYAAYGVTLGGLLIMGVIVLIQWLRAKRLTP